MPRMTQEARRLRLLPTLALPSSGLRVRHTLRWRSQPGCTQLPVQHCPGHRRTSIVSSCLCLPLRDCSTRAPSQQTPRLGMFRVGRALTNSRGTVRKMGLRVATDHSRGERSTDALPALVTARGSTGNRQANPTEGRHDAAESPAEPGAGQELARATIWPGTQRRREPAAGSTEKATSKRRRSSGWRRTAWATPTRRATPSPARTVLAHRVIAHARERAQAARWPSESCSQSGRCLWCPSGRGPPRR